MEARLLIDEPACGSWNMALDEALLAAAAESGRVTLRFYAWSEPTVSIGYFQASAERTAHPPSLTCPWVRRATGGGALVHDREVTYSLARPSGRGQRGAARDLYAAFHETLVAELAGWGVSARLAEPWREAGTEPWLCFERRAAGDVVVGTNKVCGSAQRRRDGGLLQHGSLLLGRSPFAPELAGIAELAGREIDAGGLVQGWIDRLGRALCIQFRRESLSAVETQTASWLQSSRFTNLAWNHKR